MRVLRSDAMRFGISAGMIGLGLLLLFSTAWAATANFTVNITPGPQCYDGLDNDEDGDIDYPDDADCTSTADDSEGEPVVAGPPPSGGSGGGGGLSILPSTSIIFFGVAYPKSHIVLLLDAQIAATTTAGSDASFHLALTDLNAGDHLFTLYSESEGGLRSALNPFQVSLARGSITSVGVVITPTVDVRSSEIRRGDVLDLHGNAAPNANMLVEISSEHDHYFYSFAASEDGTYTYSVDTDGYADGAYYLKVKETTTDGISSGFSRALTFWIGEHLDTVAPGTCGRGDLNCDGAVNLIDFSVAAYWYGRPLSGTFLQMETQVLNADEKIDLIDFSILAFYWTG